MLKLVKSIIIVPILILLSACGGKLISINTNAFDNSTTLSMLPTRGLDCQYAKCWLIGAEHNSANQDTILIKAEIHRVWFGMTKMMLNIDGDKRSSKSFSLTSLEQDTIINTKISKDYFSFNLDYIRKISSAQNVTGRVITTDGYSDFIIKRDNKNGHSGNNLVKFINTIDGI